MSVTAVPLQPVKTSYKVWLWAGIAAAVLLAFGVAWIGTREQVALHLPVDQDAQFLDWHKGQIGIRTTASGLQYELVKPGSGANAGDGDGAILQIKGSFRDGTVFQPPGPDQWLVGGQDRIPGYAEAVKLMNKGSKYRFWIPAALGYGATPDNPRMRKNAMLIFDIEMVEHITAAEIRALQEEQARQQQMMLQQQLQQGGGGNQAAPEGAPKGQ
ncbi:MAG: FKBP-type peptidyl-prolyl cis-trans isomerase [Sphingomonas sp.]